MQGRLRGHGISLYPGLPVPNETMAQSCRLTPAHGQYLGRAEPPGPDSAHGGHPVAGVLDIAREDESRIRTGQAAQGALRPSANKRAGMRPVSSQCCRHNRRGPGAGPMPRAALGGQAKPGSLSLSLHRHTQCEVVASVPGPSRFTATGPGTPCGGPLQSPINAGQLHPNFECVETIGVHAGPTGPFASPQMRRLACATRSALASPRLPPPSLPCLNAPRAIAEGLAAFRGHK